MGIRDDDEGRIRAGVGARLRTARESRSLTQQQVADRFSVTKGTVSAWETGRGAPDAYTLRSLARMYGVTADALLWEQPGGEVWPFSEELQTTVSELTAAKLQVIENVIRAHLSMAPLEPSASQSRDTLDRLSDDLNETSATSSRKRGNSRPT